MRDAGFDRGRDGPPNSVTGSRQATHHPTQAEQPSCGVSDKFCDRRAVVMAQHEASLCLSNFKCSHQEQRCRLISCDNVQPRRDFCVTPWNLAWLFPTCQLTRSSTSSQQAQARPDFQCPWPHLPSDPEQSRHPGSAPNNSGALCHRVL